MKKLLEIVTPKKEEDPETPPPRPPPPSSSPSAPSAPSEPSTSTGATAMSDTNDRMAAMMAQMEAFMSTTEATMAAMRQEIAMLKKAKTPDNPDDITAAEVHPPPGAEKDVLVMTRSGTGYQADTDSREASPTSSKRTSKRRQRGRSRSKGRTASEASSRQASQDRERARDKRRIPMAVGVERVIKPIGAAASMALGAPGEYEQAEKDKARLDVNKRLTRSRLDHYLQEERREQEKKIEKRRATIKAVDLHPNHQEFQRLGTDKIEKIQKSLKKTYGLYSMKEAKALDYFLNKFVSTINDYTISENEAMDMLVDFFQGDLKTIVHTHLDSQGLERTIALLRFFKADGNTILNQRDDIGKWKLKKTSTEPLKDQLLKLYSMYTSAYPASSETSRLDMFKDKVLQFCPENNNLMEQDEDYFDKFGVRMDIRKYTEAVEKAFKHGKSTTVKDSDIFHSGNQKSAPATGKNQHNREEDLKGIIAHLNRIDQKIDSRSGTHTGHSHGPQQGSGGVNIFYKSTDAGFSGVASKFRKKRDLNADLPEISAEEVPFRRFRDGKIEPHPDVDMRPFPTDKGIFMWSPTANRHFVTRATQAFYRTRCATCGIPGHSSDSSGCPMRDSVDAWTLCPRCRCGFHLNCPYTENFVRVMQRMVN